jgi:ABC-type transporter Mla subunit MlaD
MMNRLDAPPRQPEETLKNLAEQVDRLTANLNEIWLATQQQSEQITQLVATTDQQVRNFADLLQRPDREG